VGLIHCSVAAGRQTASSRFAFCVPEHLRNRWSRFMAVPASTLPLGALSRPSAVNLKPTRLSVDAAAFTVHPAIHLRPPPDGL
jgi:hypothetical protein